MWSPWKWWRERRRENTELAVSQCAMLGVVIEPAHYFEVTMLGEDPNKRRWKAKLPGTNSPGLEYAIYGKTQIEVAHKVIAHMTRKNAGLKR